MREKHYLEGLTSIRFILAALVVLTHCNQNLKGFGIYWYRNAPILYKGEFAVECFFILSGFLLTHLAYIEYNTIGKINYKSFFIRRMLRIFPLYYLAVFLGYIFLGLIYPALMGERYLKFSLLEGLPYHLLLLPNWITSKYNEGIGSLYTLWSVGVEEQFYIFFPFICSLFFKKKRPAIWFGAIAICYFTFYKLVQMRYPSSFPIEFKYFIVTLKFHFMLLGGVTALLFQKYKSEIKFVLSFKQVQLAIVTMFLLLISTRFFAGYKLIHGAIFCLFLISITDKSTSLINLENRFLKYLGAISFGIYVYHPLASYLLRYLLKVNHLAFELIANFPVLYYALELFTTIIIAGISYKFYEQKFLSYKKRFKA